MEPVHEKYVKTKPSRNITGNMKHLVKAFSLTMGFFLGMAANLGAQPTLKDGFKNDFLIGAALNQSQFTGANAMETALVKQQFDAITPENVLKWYSLHPALDRYDFTMGDRYVEFGETNGMFIIGHTLIWHEGTPKWVVEDNAGQPVSRDVLLQRMRDHIFTVVGRYKGRVKGWDVVNEAVDGSQPGGLRQTPWLKIIGDDYLLKAYQFAHEADPQAELYYNDYGLEDPKKRAAAMALIKKLQSQGVKITAVGLQGHYGLKGPKISQVDATISAFATLGIKVNITELDVNVLPDGQNPYTNGLPDSVQQQLAARYAELFSVFLKHRSQINRVTFWGVTDAGSWLNNWPVRGRVNYPLLFDRQRQPKPAFDAILHLAATGGI
jgi:endo-1,4-beta-xylanase